MTCCFCTYLDRGAVRAGVGKLAVEEAVEGRASGGGGDGGLGELGGEAARVDVANAYHVARVYSSREREKDALLTVFILGQKNGSRGSANGEVARASI